MALRPFQIPSALVETGAIMAMAPWVFAARMSSLALSTPLQATLDIQQYAAEKSVAAFDAGVDTAMEMWRMAATGHFGGGGSEAANRIATAALKPVSRRVKANAGPKR